jgi:carboxymethylenebutenolidase
LAAAVAVAVLWTPPVPADTPPAAPTVSPATAPPGTEALDLRWVDVAAPGLGVMRAAVAQPPGKGPFPAVVLLHGTHGFARQYLQLAHDLARGGVLALAPCWFSGGGGPGARFVTPIDAGQAAPAMPAAQSPEALRIVGTLLEAVRSLPDVRRDRVALFGHSRGAGAALHYVLERGGIQAAVLNSGGYPHELAARAPQVRIPLLILHGVADGPADGGSEMTAVQMARDFEGALRRAGASVDAHYYEGGGHNGFFTSKAQYEDEVQRMRAFLRRHLE